MAKLTLNVDESVVARAKRYAARRGTSVSRLVEQLLALSDWVMHLAARRVP